MAARIASAAVVLAFVAISLPAQAQAANPGPGCLPAQRAVAYHAGSSALSPQPNGAPIPCGMQTGFAGGESAIAVTNSGAVMYAPAVQPTAGSVRAQYFLGGNSAFARTTDNGTAWDFVDPIGINDSFLAGIAGPGADRFSGTTQDPVWDQIDDKFYVDRTTGRLFWTDPDLQDEIVLYTDNSGVTWTQSPLPIGYGGEWTQVTTAKAITAKPTGYPEVVYACGEYDSLSRDYSTKFEGDICQKSLDGGQTWDVLGQGFFGSPNATHAQCDGATESPDFSPWAAPDPQGRLYELMYCDGRTYLLRSSDEGATWPIYLKFPYKIANVGPGGTGAAELRSDAKGNLYMAWSNPGNPDPNGPYAPGAVYLATSTDGGRTWSRPMSVLAPGVTGIRTHFGFDVDKPGQVAISYLGTRHGRAGADGNPGFDGYITYTEDALAKRPLFWAGITNPTGQAPLDNGTKGSSGGLGLDYVSVSIGPDGTPWASFWDACGDDLPKPTPNCPASRSPSDALTFGYMDWAGRLAAASPAAPAPHRCPAPTGRLTQAGIGSFRLGMSRHAARRLLPGYATRDRNRMDFFCLRTSGIRAGYRGARIVLLLTANPAYSIRGVRAGTRLASVARRLGTGPGFRIGLNTWFLFDDGSARGVFKVRHRVIGEIGIANRRLTATRAASRRFLSSFGAA